MIDLLYVAHNRLEFTRASFATLIENTNWDLVQKLHVLDDISSDGTTEYLMNATEDLYEAIGVKIDCISKRFGGPVPAMNLAADTATSGTIAKIDNDVIVCPGWLDHMLEAMSNDPDIDCLGMEPGFGDVCPDDSANVIRRCKPARFIGGVGLIRTRIFRTHRPQMNRRWFGWTRHQEEYANCAWVDPDLPVFLLDHLPSEPWRSLTKHYVEQGWARAWNHTYDTAMTERYAGWWLTKVTA